MVLDTSRSSTSTATLTATRATIPPADPWDAPYFGGAVYFSYQPTLPAAAVHTAVATYEALPAGSGEDGASVAAMSGALPADPWDAPYFGGPVYLGYHPGTLAAAPAVASAASGVSATTSASSTSFVFAPWDAPYFGGPVYLRYPDFPVTSFGSAGILAAPAELAAVALGLGVETPSTDSGEQSPGAAPSEAGVSLPAAPQGGGAGKRRGWLTRFFRGELYIGRRA